MTGLTLVTWALWAAPSPAAEPPVASFTTAPAAPLTLEPVQFRSTSSGEVTATTWDLDGDGACDDAQGPTASRTFPLPAGYRVRICATGPGGDSTQTRTVVIGDRAPAASFTYVATAPRTGEDVYFVAGASDPDGSVAAYDWDLDGDGVFGDAAGVTASRVFLDPGAYAVSLRVTDDAGAATVVSQTVTVAPSMIWPPPRVRLLSRVNARSLSVRILRVQAPAGAMIDVRCRGRGCGRRHETRAAPAPTASGLPRNVRFGRFERRLRVRAVLEIRVTRRGGIGTYTAFTVRPGEPPRRTDLCLAPGSDAPGPCPGA